MKGELSVFTYLGFFHKTVVINGRNVDEITRKVISTLETFPDAEDGAKLADWKRIVLEITRD